MNRFTTVRIRTLAALLIITPLGFATKWYAGPFAAWVNYSLGGVLYVVFWALFVCVIMPGIGRWRVSASVFAATCAVEVLQLWHPPLLNAIRRTFIGATLLGTSFSWLDMIHYCAGFVLSVVVVRLLQHDGNRRQ